MLRTLLTWPPELSYSRWASICAFTVADRGGSWGNSLYVHFTSVPWMVTVLVHLR